MPRIITAGAFQCPYPVVYGVLKSSKNRRNVKVFWPSIFGEGRPRIFYGRLLARFTVQRFAKFGWVPPAKPGNELECRIYVGWVKRRSNFKPFVDQSSCRFEMIYVTPSSWHAHLLDCLCRVSFLRYRPLKSPLSCEVIKKVGLGPRVVGGADTPDFGHAFWNGTHFQAYLGWMTWVPFSELRQ